MESLKSVFNNGVLTYEEFEAKCKENNIKLANLESGEYVDKEKLTRTNTSLNELKDKYARLVEDTKDYESNKKELNLLKQEKENDNLLSKIHEAKVDNKYAKFVLSEVKGKVDDNNSFDDVLKGYVKENPHFLETRSSVYLKGSSSPNLENANGNPQETENEIMNNIIRNRE